MSGRRDFLGWLGASTLLAAIARPESAWAEPSAVPSPRSLAPQWDMSWFDRLKGKQVGVFDSPEFSDGAAIFRAAFWRKQYAEVYGTPASAMVPVVVVRHAAIAMVMNNEFWARYQIGKELKLKDPATKKWTLVNPMSGAATGTPPEFADLHIPGLLNSGGVVLACHLAFGACVGRIAEKEKLSQEAAETRARSMLIPGVILQPSGFFAVLKAQETGGGYILGS